jgi:hypothetical protein
MKVQKKCCNKCLFSKNHVVSGEQRRQQIIRDALANDTFFVCHKSSIQSDDGHGDVCCRAYWDQFKNEFQLGRIVQRLGGPEFVEIK